MRRRDRTEAGRFARAHYEQGLSAWRRRFRPRAAVALAAAIVLAVPVWLFFPAGTFFAGLFVGSVLGMVVWLWSAPPEHVARWGRGAEGEEATARVLEELPESWQAFHDRDGGRGNVDHIVVGPGGVFVLDSKNLNGSIGVDGRALRVTHADAPLSGFSTERYGNAVAFAARRLKQELQEQTGINLWVQGVVVVWGDFDEGAAEDDRVAYVHGRKLVEWLTGRPGWLSGRQRQLIQLALDADMVAPRLRDVAHL